MRPLVTLIVVNLLLVTDVLGQSEAEALFVRRILPLLNEKCIGCHGQDSQSLKGALDLSSLAAARIGGESGRPAIVPGEPTISPLYLAVTREEGDWSAMPPKDSERLTGEQVQWIKTWITGGAPWPSANRIAEIAKSNAEKWSSEVGTTVPTSGGLSVEWTSRTYQPEALWGYRSVEKPNAPSGENPVDAFIDSRLPQGLDSAPPARAGEFIRRATFDLTGLPPTPEEVTEFEAVFAIDAGAAIEKLIDRLLDSPHYGERYARHWLDVTRYADSSGLANDYERGCAWRYRDYVVRAFNNDKPYDQFVLEQIAGDEVDPTDPEKIVATGFLRMGPWELTGMEVEKIARQRFLDDVVNSVGETFLAQSLQCARCHDHKFDPIPTRDYYAIQAVFSTTQLAERDAPFLPTENTQGFEERAYLEKTRAQHEASLSELDNLLLENAQTWIKDHAKDLELWNKAVDTARKQALEGKANGKNTNRNSVVRRGQATNIFASARNILISQRIPEDDFPPKLVGFTPEQFGLERIARKGIERLSWVFDRYEPFALAVYNGRTRELKSVNVPLRVPEDRTTKGELERTCILVGGDPFAEGPAVAPGVLSAIHGVPSIDIPESLEGRRLAFAKWVANKDNPLTTRAIVNRIWLWHFNEPLAGNPNNFGSTGKRPTHPELLDWLAATFVEQGWSFKKLHRIIMNSQTYRRSSQHPDWDLLRDKDALGTSYAVFKPRRLTGEELRDAMLHITGELNLTVGGIPNRPEINQEAALQPRQVMGTFAAAWVPNPLPHQRHRRSLYALRLRGLSDPTMEVFNAPAPDFSCERRETSTVTPQVFAFFNSQASLSRSMALAARVLKEADNDRSAVARCFQLVFGRSARSSEIESCIDHWRKMEQLHDQAAFKSTIPALQVLREAVDENTGEKFTFNETLHANLDFIPDLQSADCDAHTRAFADVCLALLNSNEFAYVY